MFLKVVFFIFVVALSYMIASECKEKKVLERVNKYISEKNEEYYEDFLRKYEKNKKIKLVEKFNIIYKLNLLISRANLPRNIFINPYSIIFYVILCVLIACKISFSFFKIITLAAISAIPFGIIPIIIIAYISKKQEEKIESCFLNFILQLKNYTKIDNDITTAFKEIETIEPLKSYIKRFNIEIGSGIKFEEAMEHLKEKISIKKFKEFFSNLQYCYLYGGNFSTLIDKSYKTINIIQKEKNKRLEETKSARIVLFILIAMNMFVYVTYIQDNYENYRIMKNSFFGMAILYWNIISMWGLLWLSGQVKKLDY